VVGTVRGIVHGFIPTPGITVLFGVVGGMTHGHIIHGVGVDMAGVRLLVFVLLSAGDAAGAIHIGQDTRMALTMVIGTATTMDYTVVPGIIITTTALTRIPIITVTEIHLVLQAAVPEIPLLQILNKFRLLTREDIIALLPQRQEVLTAAYKLPEDLQI
jgi:hypothetical protein